MRPLPALPGPRVETFAAAACTRSSIADLVQCSGWSGPSEVRLKPLVSLVRSLGSIKLPGSARRCAGNPVTLDTNVSAHAETE